MTDQPSLNLLNSAHVFPGPYMFKAIGDIDDGFVARVVAAVREEIQADLDPPFSTQETPSGRHVSVTLEPEVQSSEQVLAIYARLKQLAGIKVLW